ncbi:MAG: succinylglutamate desuccinylase/aspartoacylase family protein [bacterium]|nr:succinylglutamate desuccinylase/aspartoacylase family protein [bacterium]
MALTHGNEPVGLQIFEFLQEELKVQKLLQTGQLILVVVNPLAYQHEQRFIDHNMNRISIMPYQDESYEFERLEQLKPLLQKMDVVLDVHSFSSSDDQVVICDLAHRKQCEEIFEAEVILVDKLQES